MSKRGWAALNRAQRRDVGQRVALAAMPPSPLRPAPEHELTLPSGRQVRARRIRPADLAAAMSSSEVELARRLSKLGHGEGAAGLFEFFDLLDTITRLVLVSPRAVVTPAEVTGPDVVCMADVDVGDQIHLVKWMTGRRS